MTDPSLTPARLKNDVLTLTVELPASQQEVWRRITQPELLGQWSPVVPDRPLVSTGPATSHERPEDPAVDVTVTDVREPWFLEHRWGPETVTWQLAPSGPGTQLNLVHELSQPEQASMMAAGWHLCLDVLARRLAGEQVPRCVGEDALANGWPAIRDRYEEQFTAQAPKD